MKEINQNKYKNIVIIGGSHSGFSAAWLMLNGPATYNRNNSIGEKAQNYKLPDTNPKPNPNCKECCQCTQLKLKQSFKEKDKEIKCQCICKC